MDVWGLGFRVGAGRWYPSAIGGFKKTVLPVSYVRCLVLLCFELCFRYVLAVRYTYMHKKSGEV